MFPKGRGWSAPTSDRQRRASCSPPAASRSLNHHAAQIDVRVSVDEPAVDASINLVGLRQPARRGRGGKGSASRFREQRWRGLRRSRGHPHARDRSQDAGLPVWREQARRGVLPSRPRRPPRIRGDRDAVCECVRTASGSQVRSRRRVHLRLAVAGGQTAHRVRRRQADARLRLCEGCCACQRAGQYRPHAVRYRVRRAGLQHRHVEGT